MQRTGLFQLSTNWEILDHYYLLCLKQAGFRPEVKSRPNGSGKTENLITTPLRAADIAWPSRTETPDWRRGKSGWFLLRRF